MPVYLFGDRTMPLTLQQHEYMSQTPDRVRLAYAGCIGLLCEVSTEVDTDTRESIIQAVTAWCEHTGWTMKCTLDRIDVMPPPNPEE